jgi:hypothetical protein
MNKEYNRTLALLRLIGVIVVFLGILGAAYIFIFLIAFFSGAPDWYKQSLASDAVRGTVSSPIWILGGIILLIFSRRLTGFIVKYSATTEDTEANKGQNT